MAWIAARLDGHLVDLTSEPGSGCNRRRDRSGFRKGLEILRHSASHIMAQAVKALFPEARVAIGPAIENGFYYDFDVDQPFHRGRSGEDRSENGEIIASERLPFHRKEMSREEAIRFFQKRGEKYKVELLEEIRRPNGFALRAGGFR